MNRNQLAATLIFPEPGTSFGTLVASEREVGFGELVVTAVFEMAMDTRTSFAGTAGGRFEPVSPERARSACAQATSAFRSGYSHHWLAALSEQIDDILDEEYLATVPRITQFLDAEVDDARRADDATQARILEWAIALLRGGDVDLPDVSEVSHGGLLEAAAGAAAALEVAAYLDELDAEGCEGHTGCSCTLASA